MHKYLFLGLRRARGANPGAPQQVSVTLDEESDEEAGKTIEGYDMLVSGTLYRLVPVRTHVSTEHSEVLSKVPLFFEH